MKNGVCVILPNNLGDVIMALPVLEGLKRRDPETVTTFFAESGFEGGLVNSPSCDRIFRFDRARVRDLARTSEWRKALVSLKDQLADLQCEPFDRVINLSQHPYVSYIASLIPCKNRAGQEYLRAGNNALRDPWSQYLYAIPFARRYNCLHASDIYRKIAGLAQFPAEASMAVTPDELRTAGEFLAASGMPVSEGPLVVFQPGAALPSKRWPLEHFVALGKRLAGDGYRIVLTGAPAESDIATGIGSAIGRESLVTAGKLTFRQSIALLPFAQGCVTGDTAIMHAAAALKKKVYALFGPTSPVETGPCGEGHIVFAGRCASRPCFCFDCKTRLCMRSILPDDVYAHIKGSNVMKGGCDIYKTKVDAEGMAGLDPLAQEGTSYYDQTGAPLTRRVVEPGYIPALPNDRAGHAAVRHETAAFLAALTGAEGGLSDFVNTRAREGIRRFEEARLAMGNLGGIAAFWMALLNLRLNSIPVLDPVAAVGESLTVCRGMRSAIESAVSMLP